ncbi:MULTISPECIES: tyrosine-type recombinase/integrase [Halobacterium]|uniref:tyrosine-type recombinase/integrase n=1 Tax=Halobacterium TaxID=2239 RepID=UPI0019632ADA|nr:MULTISPECIES: tyrosine-type recombinase/integrase [Halobacterium]MCF2164696.1 hypothetical protein [Halobacterium salinarum]MCF2166858.1 hypothetical protein [Halobacterium salinarum]MCF2237737.1 hypothetical protein [Halobacterium salinarum]QRY22802.1 hypothetical protein JT689_01870 [Halobacterium sp. GSL-19]WJK64107.1 hypothetical protein QSJ49_02805 [Halobacterium salinarum]
MLKLDKTDKQSESILDTDKAEALLEYQHKFEHASRPHVIIEILWHTRIRLGALHALDLDDYDEDEDRLTLRHRPEEETPLRNTAERERIAALSTEVCRSIEGWRDYNHHYV